MIQSYRYIHYAYNLNFSIRQKGCLYSAYKSPPTPHTRCSYKYMLVLMSNIDMPMIFQYRQRLMTLMSVLSMQYVVNLCISIKDALMDRLYHVKYFESLRYWYSAGTVKY